MLKLIIALICSCFVSANYEKESRFDNVNILRDFLLTLKRLRCFCVTFQVQEIPWPIIMKSDDKDTLGWHLTLVVQRESPLGI